MRVVLSGGIVVGCLLLFLFSLFYAIGVCSGRGINLALVPPNGVSGGVGLSVHKKVIGENGSLRACRISLF